MCLSRLLLLMALLLESNPFMLRRTIRISSRLAVGTASNDENILQEILLNQLKLCIVHLKIDSAAIYIDPTVFNGGVYKDLNLQLLCSYSSLEKQNSYIDIADYNEDHDNGEGYDGDNEFDRSNNEQQLRLPIVYQSCQLGVLKLTLTDALADEGRNTFMDTLIKSIALVIFNEHEYSKGVISKSKTKSMIGDAYNALFTSRTLAKMVKKRLVKNDLIGTEMVDNIMSQSEFMASLITNMDGNNFSNSDNFDASNRKYIDVDDDDNDVILENNVIVKADINTQQIEKEGAGRDKNIFFRKSSSLVRNGTHQNALGPDIPVSASTVSPQPNPDILLIKKSPSSASEVGTNSSTEKSRVIPAEFWSPNKIEKIVKYNETNDTM